MVQMDQGSTLFGGQKHDEVMKNELYINHDNNP